MPIARLKLVACSVFALSAAWALPATAQDAKQSWAYCTNAQGSFGPEIVISGCNAIIQSGSVAPGDMAFAVYNRGVARFNQRDFPNAIADFNQAIAINPSIEVFHFYRGYALYEQGNYAEALEDFNRALAINPQHAQSWGGRGSTYRMQGDYARAIADYTQALSLDLSAELRAQLLEVRAIARYQAGDYREAIVDFDAAEAIWQDGWSLYGRGLARIRLGQVAEGRADIATATARQPDVVQSFASRGVQN